MEHEPEVADDISHIMALIQDELPSSSSKNVNPPPQLQPLRGQSHTEQSPSTRRDKGKTIEAVRSPGGDDSSDSEAEAERILLGESNDSDTSDSDTDTDSDSSESDTSGHSNAGPSSPASRSRLRKELDSMTASKQEGADDELDNEDEGGAGITNLSFFASKNEILAPEVALPTITEIEPDEYIEHIGVIMSIIDSVVIVKGDPDGRVIDSESMLVFDDRKVLGLVFETFGPVSAPMYSIRFPTAASIDPTVQIGQHVFSVPARSSYVFAERLKLLKGSDASNVFDEEPGEDEMEFSDDEKEAEHKRSKKQNRHIQNQPMLQKSLASLADDGVAYDGSPYDDQLSMPPPRAAPAPYDDLFGSEPPLPYGDDTTTLTQGNSQRPGQHGRERGRGLRGRGSSRGRNDGPRGRGRGRGRDPRRNSDPGRDAYRPHWNSEPQGSYLQSQPPMPMAGSSTEWTDYQPYDPTNAVDFSLSALGIDGTTPYVQPHINPLFVNNFAFANPYMQQLSAMQAMGMNMQGYGYDADVSGQLYEEGGDQQPSGPYSYHTDGAPR